MRKIFTWLMAITFIAGVLCTASYAANSPKDVYDKYLKACKSGDIKKIMPFLVKENQTRISKMDAKKQAQFGGFMKAMAPTSYKVTKQQVAGDKATLTVSGKQNGDNSTGTISMKKEAGIWKVLKESWSTKVKAKTK